MDGGDESSATADDYKQGTPGLLTTVVVPPRAQDNKKVRDREYQRNKRASASRQSDSEDEAMSTASGRRVKRQRRED